MDCTGNARSSELKQKLLFDFTYIHTHVRVYVRETHNLLVSILCSVRLIFIEKGRMPSS